MDHLQRDQFRSGMIARMFIGGAVGAIGAYVATRFIDSDPSDAGRAAFWVGFIGYFFGMFASANVQDGRLRFRHVTEFSDLLDDETPRRRTVREGVVALSLLVGVYLLGAVDAGRKCGQFAGRKVIQRKGVHSTLI